MKRSRFDPWDRAFARGRAVGYHDVTVDPPTVARYYPPSLAYAAGGIMSTARDLLKYDRALYDERLLPQETLDEAFTPGMRGCGLGWIIDHMRMQGERNKLVWHSGGGPGFRSLLMRMVDARVTLVLLFNTTGNDSESDEEVSELVLWERHRRRVKRFAQEVGNIVLRESG